MSSSEASGRAVARQTATVRASGKTSDPKVGIVSPSGGGEARSLRAVPAEVVEAVGPPRPGAQRPMSKRAPFEEMRRTKARRRAWLRVTAMAVVGAALSMAGLWALPGRSSESKHAEVAEAERVPEAEGHFDLSVLHWDMSLYRSDARLEPLRREFSRSCGGLEGLVAAGCIGDLFHRSFPGGAPKHEFVDATYDPAADLASHLAGGEPGHCVTRAGLVAATLLASGIPARVVQIRSVGSGHTLVEVWDRGLGWVLSDPTMSPARREPRSAVDAVLRDSSPRLPARAGDGIGADERDRGPREQAQLAYPEPWLYTRVGERAAAWPLRGLFVSVGPRRLLDGPVQTLLRWLVVGQIGLAGIAALIAYRRRPEELAPSGHEQELASPRADARS